MAVAQRLGELAAPHQRVARLGDPAGPVEDTIIAHRDQDFVQWVLDDVADRQQAEDEFYAGGPS